MIKKLCSKSVREADFCLKTLETAQKSTKKLGKKFLLGEKKATHKKFLIRNLILDLWGFCF
jgi:hypothetical protein